MRIAIAVAVAVTMMSAAGWAHAQPQDVLVEISATQPGSYIEVRGGCRDFPCGERCVLTLPQHQYRLSIRDTEGNVSKAALNIFHPTSLTVTPGNHADKMRGIGLFVGGLVTIAAGAVVLMLAQHDDVLSRMGECSTRNCSGAPTWMWYVGGVGLATGLAVGATGLVLWRKNARAVVDTRPLTGWF